MIDQKKPFFFNRKLLTDDRGDAQFNQGQFIVPALKARDGSNGEHGRVKLLRRTA